jgi:hypothetical protein
MGQTKRAASCGCCAGSLPAAGSIKKASAAMLDELKVMLDVHNALVKKYSTIAAVGQMVDPAQKFSLRLSIESQPIYTTSPSTTFGEKVLKRRQNKP